MTSTVTHSARRWTLGAVLWLSAMTIMASFQTWRGAYEDGVLFFGIVILLALDRAFGERLGSKLKRLRIAPAVIWGVTALFGVVLVLAPRHGLVTFVTMTLLGALMLVLAWPQLPATSSTSTPAIRRSAWWWAIIAVLLCFWEAIAFVLSVTMPGGSAAHPTISVLLDPALETLLGRIVFVGLWLAAGAGLVLIWRRK